MLRAAYSMRRRLGTLQLVCVHVRPLRGAWAQARDAVTWSQACVNVNEWATALQPRPLGVRMVLVFRVNENSPRGATVPASVVTAVVELVVVSVFWPCCLRSDFTSCRPTKRSN